MSEKNHQDYYPLLDEAKSKVDDHEAVDGRKIRRFLTIPLLIHSVLILVYTSVFLSLVWNLSSQCRRADGVVSSARSVLEYGTRQFDDIDDLHRYFGKPTPQLDAAWNKLLKYQWLSVPEADMRKLGRLEEGIQLPDGGYFATLGVFHDLHCLRRVHHTFYQSHYFPDLTEEEKVLDRLHAAHCLDSIRQSVQCQGDVSLLTMRWDAKLPKPLGNFSARHECVNFDRIRDWARDHTYDVMAKDVLVHPIYGPAYPDGKAALGVVAAPVD
ncbi:hypothetical protein B0H66DRAFT_538719 [Apodospora peruviana]|uniref:Tat pathway signal sequence n=1 Tax=Apodospora peruviana TaxID=516989 RepID=A0AAE0HT79_9PEZI|nr:hypothetical protein B0H66DRAFT_538719 [Apodospora peruviana]